MANCESCKYRQAFDTAVEIVEHQTDIFSEGKRTAKLRELDVLQKIFDSIPEEPSCASLRSGDDHPYRCSKAGYFSDVRNFVFGNPDVEISGKANHTIGFNTQTRTQFD